jgi:UDP-glucose 4-epimerase
MIRRILITGSSGLIGSALVPLFAARGVDLEHLDLAGAGGARGDVRDEDRVARAISRCDGVVHLAAVSRVVWGERSPALCRATNVGGLRNVLGAAASSPLRPWVIFASSREVYGQPDRLPATEDCPQRPVNAYGRSKAEGERLAESARREGLRACTVRLSNVFGSTADHPDRVVPAFARGALAGQELRVDGLHHGFDFTVVDDVARGILELAEVLASSTVAPAPIHLVSGIRTTLGELATMAIRIARSRSTIRPAPPRDFDVATFVGDPARARAVLGWQPRVALEVGLGRLIEALRHVEGVARPQELVP